MLILSEGVKPERILTMTFNKAAQVEMQTRFSSLLGSRATSPILHLSQLAMAFFMIMKNAREIDSD